MQNNYTLLLRVSGGADQTTPATFFRDRDARRTAAGAGPKRNMINRSLQPIPEEVAELPGMDRRFSMKPRPMDLLPEAEESGPAGPRRSGQGFRSGCFPEKRNRLHPDCPRLRRHHDIRSSSGEGAGVPAPSVLTADGSATACLILGAGGIWAFAAEETDFSVAGAVPTAAGPFGRLL